MGRKTVAHSVIALENAIVLFAFNDLIIIRRMKK